MAAGEDISDDIYALADVKLENDCVIKEKEEQEQREREQQYELERQENEARRQREREDKARIKEEKRLQRQQEKRQAWLAENGLTECPSCRSPFKRESPGQKFCGRECRRGERLARRRQRTLTIQALQELNLI